MIVYQLKQIILRERKRNQQISILNVCIKDKKDKINKHSQLLMYNLNITVLKLILVYIII